MIYKYINDEGLNYLWGKVKDLVSSQTPFKVAIGTGTPYNIWQGTYSEYAALTPNESTVYLITTPPYDAEIEYLQSNGSEYINTGITPSSDIKLTIDGLYTTTSSNALIHGAIDQSGSTYRRFHIGISNTYWQGGIGTAVNGTGSGSINTSRHTFLITGKTGAAYVDSTVITGNTTAFPSVPIFLFARNFSGTAGNMGSFRMYSAEIYSYSQNKKLLDLIPVRKGTVGYLYDKVSGQLFGTPTGAFTLGSDVV